MRVSVDSERCQGHGRCFIECPEVFAADDEGFSIVTVAEPDASLALTVNRAADSCPERAIQVALD
jgi:ferredoxin